MSLIECIAAGFGLVCVILTIRQSIWCWPTGLVQVLLFIYVFWQAKLYSDVILHVVYVGLQIYGWWAWLHGGRGGEELRVSRLSRRVMVSWIAIGIAGTIVIGLPMHRLTDASMPYWDASVLVLSLIAQWLMARKILESWIFWIAVDVLAVGLYAVKALYPTTALYAVFLVLAILGLQHWKRSMTHPGAAQPG